MAMALKGLESEAQLVGVQCTTTNLYFKRHYKSILFCILRYKFVFFLKDLQWCSMFNERHYSSFKKKKFKRTYSGVFKTLLYALANTATGLVFENATVEPLERDYR